MPAIKVLSIRLGTGDPTLHQNPAILLVCRVGGPGPTANAALFPLNVAVTGQNNKYDG